MEQRKQIIIDELIEILEDASGIELRSADINTSLIELGLDSLFLTQVSLTLTKKYNTKITFRQLNEELSSINAIAGHIDSSLPATAYAEKLTSSGADAKQQQQPVATSFNMPAANFTPDAEGLEWLIQQQMQLMQQQLAVLSGQPIAASPTAQTITNTVNNSETKSTSINKTTTPVIEENEPAKPFGAIARIEKTYNNQLTEAQQQWFNELIKKYTTRTAKSKQFTQEHREQLADPRVVTGFKPYNKEITYQVVVNRSKGSRIWDIDGNEYVDILNGFGSNMFGHSPDFIVEAIGQQLDDGYEIGPQHPLAGEFASLFCELTGAERVAICNTGSEAVLGAMRMARTVTGRNLICAFNNSYHGINDEVIVRGTKKLKSLPAAAGITPEAVANILVLDYGTDESLKIIRERAHEFAAIMIEPVQSRMADFQPKEFVKELRTIADNAGCALIFDEVITGFRYAQGGAQELYGVKADIASYGKVCGGGMPIGAMAGKKKYMDALDGGHWQYGDSSVPEVGVTYFAGTFVRHPFALAAGVAALKHLKKHGPQLQQELNKKAATMVADLNAFCNEYQLPIGFSNFASLFKPKYKNEYPYSELLFHLWRLHGLHVIDGFPCFLTTAHTDDDVAFIIETFKKSVFELMAMDMIPHAKKSASMNGNTTAAIVDKPVANTPPVPTARLGKDQNGRPAWFVPDPARPGKYLMVEEKGA
ncbi:MAG: aminotransferase class III-fold pyridoxal phosphate-dependent enzyme [Bacteroidetes bacterium]|nr:aminotransferase class III-fold pyridoxal phosphate-dependent enzyme [Bacteroidota bacterium]